MKEFYKVPDAEHRKNALGSLPGLPYRVKKSLEQVVDLFEPMQKPKEGEWLYEHEQQGQTFEAYKGQMHNEVNEKRNVIYIKPLEDIDKEFLHDLKTYCECFFFPMKVQIAERTNTLQKVTKRINPYTQKEQFHAKQILVKLQKTLPTDAFCLVGVCMTDLYPREQWNFVFGLASIKERTGVFSFARYDERFFQEVPYKIDYQLILWRSIAVMVHQITHMFGVRHCVFYKCIMNGSNHLEEASGKPLQLCGVCLRKMQSNIKFDILERYHKIHNFLTSKKDKRVNKSIELIETAIKRIQNNMKI